MEAWAKPKGLSEDLVMETLNKHMFHKDGGLRYSLDTDASGEIRVKVQPKRSKYGRASSVPAGCGRQPKRSKYRHAEPEPEPEQQG